MYRQNGDKYLSRYCRKYIPEKKIMTAFRLRESVIKALAELTEDFNVRSRVFFSRTAILEMLIMNELSSIKRNIDSLANSNN